MPDSKEILQAIGGILQKWETGRTKKGKKKKQTGGLKSNLRDGSSLSPRDQLYLKSQLLADKLEGRTDEGSLLSLRSKFPNF